MQFGVTQQKAGIKTHPDTTLHTFTFCPSLIVFHVIPHPYSLCWPLFNMLYFKVVYLAGGSRWSSLWGDLSRSILFPADRKQFPGI
jgi:hypothetical protein